MATLERTLINTADRELLRSASIQPDLVVAEGGADSPLSAQIFRDARMTLIVRAERVEAAAADLRRADSDSEWERAASRLQDAVAELVEASRAAKKRLSDS